MILLLLPFRSQADDIRTRVAEGNQHYASGEYEKALEAYTAAGEELPDDVRAEVLFNRAAAQFKLGKLDEARELWVRVASTRDARFEALSRFNIGNCHYAKALAALETTDPNAATAAMRALDDAVAQFRDALRLDPQLGSARANIELARKLKEEIRKNSTTQPQSQPTSDQQQEQNDPNQSQSQPSSQPSSQSSPSSQESGQDPNAQQDPNARQDPNAQPDPNSQDPNQSSQQEQTPASQPQTAPADDASEGEQQQPETQPAPQPDPNQGAADPNKLIRLSPEEAQRLLQMVRDAEKARREEMRRRQAARYRPVEKDW